MLQVIKHLQPNRFRHLVLVRSADSPAGLAEIPEAGNIRVIADRAETLNRRWAWRLADLLRTQEVDVLHVRGLTMLPDAVLAARLAGRIPVAFSFHGFEWFPPHFGWLRKQLYRMAVKACDDRWAVGPAAADAVMRTLGLPPDSVHVVANGVDTSIFRPAPSKGLLRRRLGLPDDRPVVLSVGNLKPVKGHDVLLEAIQLLGPAAKLVTLVIAGQDHQNGTLHGWAGRHLADVDVRFVGRQDDPLPWFQAADLFVLPSRWEGMSNALLEAMACGLPVIATAAGGNVDVVAHEQTGLLVPPGDPSALARETARMLHDGSLRERLGRAARSHVLAAHDVRSTAEQYAERYIRMGSRQKRHSRRAAVAATEEDRA